MAAGTMSHNELTAWESHHGGPESTHGSLLAEVNGLIQRAAATAIGARPAHPAPRARSTCPAQPASRRGSAWQRADDKLAARASRGGRCSDASIPNSPTNSSHDGMREADEPARGGRRAAAMAAGPSSLGGVRSQATAVQSFPWS
jgi:hypothetical protein